MEKDDLVYVGHMLDMARKAIGKVQGKSREDFDRDENLRMASAHLIQIIGEAARRVSHGYRRAHAEIPWDKIVGMRNRVVHDYMNVDYEIVWEVLSADLPALAGVLEKAVPPEPEEK